MPKAYIEKVGEEEFRKKPIGSGPWKFVVQRAGRSHRVHRRHHAALARPAALQDLHVLLVPEESARVAMVRTGEAAIALDRAGDQAMLSACVPAWRSCGARHHAGDFSCLWELYKPEVKDQPLAKTRVRQACRWRLIASR